MFRALEMKAFRKHRSLAGDSLPKNVGPLQVQVPVSDV